MKIVGLKGLDFEKKDHLWVGLAKVEYVSNFSKIFIEKVSFK